MATATKEIDITITLVMDEREARFLRNLTQNCIDGDLAAESLDDREDRESIFEAVDTGLKKRK